MGQDLFVSDYTRIGKARIDKCQEIVADFRVNVNQYTFRYKHCRQSNKLSLCVCVRDVTFDPDPGHLILA